MADTIIKLNPEIVIGTDTINRAGALCAKWGKKVLLVTEQRLYDNKLIERLIKVLEESGLETILFDEIPAQAGAEAAENAASLARGARCNMILGFGGLKTQYIARLISILAASPLRLFDLFDGRKEEKAFLPYVAIPSALGDPFLFSDYLVIADPRDSAVKLINCPQGLCRAVIMDSANSETLSGKHASTAALDGLCVSLEAYCSAKSNFLSDALLEQSMALYGGMLNSFAGSSAGRASSGEASIPASQIYDFPALSINAGLLMSLGVSLSAPGIGTALAFAINARFQVSKSWCATVLLPHIMEKLVAARPEKMARAAALLGESIDGVSTADAANLALESVCRHMGQLDVPARLKDFNLSLDRLVPTAEAARNLEFLAFSPWTVASEDAYDLLKLAF